MKRIVVCLTLLFTLSRGPSLFAQAAGYGAISGIVHDQTAARIPGAEVTIGTAARGVVRTVISNEAGVFSAPALVPGSGYTVTVKLAGFQDYTAQNINLQVGQEVSLDVGLSVAGATTTVSIVAEAPVVDVTKTEVSQVVTATQIQELPINGRRVDSFVLLTPGVVPDGTFGLISFRGVAGGNSFLTDGNDTTNQFYNENAGRTRISSQISQDAVQEFQVLTNGYSAEFGRATGGVVNTVTRSGTNDTHGTAYWFFRNQAFNARDRYATINPKETRNQAGGSVGGRFIPDKLFYFLNLEITRRDFPLISRQTNPSFFDANGNFIAACTATAAQCDAARHFLDRNFQTVDRHANTDLGFFKLDWIRDPRNTISASINALRWISPNGIQTQAVLTNGAGVGGNADSTVRTRYGRLSWTNIASNSTLNELRFGWFKDRLFDEPNPSLIPPETGRIVLSVGALSNLGMDDRYPRLNPSEQRFELADSLSWTLGQHTMKFGGDFASNHDYMNIRRNQFGTYSYANWTAFAQDFSGNTTGAKRWQSFSQTFGNPIIDFTTTDFSLFGQDQFRASQKLTLNYGLRYDYSWLPTPPTKNADYPQTATIHEPAKNFAPRIGFSYALDDKTVVRGGYGVFFARFHGAIIQTFFISNGVYQPAISLSGSNANDLAAGPVFPSVLSSNAGLPTGSVDVTFPAADFRNPYTQQADIAVERELTRNTSLTVNGIWSRGVHLYTTRDLNVGPTGPNVTYRINDASGNQVGTYSTPTYLLANRVDPRYRRVMQVDNGGNSYYSALAVQLKKRLSKGFEGSVAYTWSHAIDTANVGISGDSTLLYNTVRSTFNGDYSGDKGSSALDQRHRLVVTTIFQPTFTNADSKIAKFLVNNWQLTQVTTAASAQFATATVRVSGSPFAGAAFTTSLNGLGGSNRVPFQPFSNIPIDSVFRTDARLSKLLPINESVKLYVNFEGFNIFNHVADTFVFTEAYSATNGILTPTPGLGDGNASQGYPDGTNARRAQLSFRLVF